ncbi:hypothetical protein DACRYDRAFT_115190 [Dacryopinax primogenitus]|uniref:Uncharacterized protein n=1 Tax=Dacryopinax primogenitus (strain DJM 731) TaxID=1858805 RepID=M5GF66_DACPD|nr:uncharacterized protein DACRYDRAFT_115190 [Dacryopinax primogenitus]EJU03888.1 hypothetical protein DACRYDRAFT_115190 [Dacryopinax primogenitus]
MTLDSVFVADHLQSTTTCYIQTLPFELLSHVFIICEQNYNAALTTPPDLRHNSCAFVLRSVCKQWNEVALCTPQLWTRIRILGPRTLALAEMWIQRSGAQELDISIILSSPTEIAASNALIEPHLSRIVTMHFGMTCGTTIYTPAQPAPLIPDTIRSLRFANIGFSNCTALRRNLSLFQRLKYLDLSSSSTDEKWMSVDEIRISRPDWFLMEELEEILLPMNALCERVRQYLLAPRLRYSSIRGHYFAPSPANTLIVREDLSSEQGPLGVHIVLLQVPEVESLTLIWSNRTADFLKPTFCDYALHCLGMKRHAFPLPDMSLSEDEWTDPPQMMLPRLRNLRMCNVPRIGTVDALYDRYVPTYTGSLPAVLERVEIDGPVEPTTWPAVAKTLREHGTTVIESFGTSIFRLQGNEPLNV